MEHRDESGSTSAYHAGQIYARLGAPVLEYPARMICKDIKPARAHLELPLAKLRWRCEPSRIPFETTAQTEPREGFIGQERALRALKMGVELSAPGYNVFVCGLAATRRRGTLAPLNLGGQPAAQALP